MAISPAAESPARKAGDRVGRVAPSPNRNIRVKKIPLSVVEPVQNLGAPINTTQDEFAPALASDGSFMIFNSKRGAKYQDLHISKFDFQQQKWGTPKPITELNSPYNDEAPTLSADGKLLIFSSDRDGSLELPRDKLGRIKVSFDIYFSVREGSTWSLPRKLPGDVNTIHHERAPNLSRNGERLYYTSWKFGSLKKTVLMRSDFSEGKFINVRPMPPVLNAGFQELGIIESNDGEGYFFSSTRPGGLGGWDIYYVSHKDGSFGEVINLGKKVNSVANDVFLSALDQRFFISSNRENGKGRFDIYSTFVFSKQKNFETRAIYFDYNSPKLKKVSYPYLDAFIKFLEENNEIKVKITGHTDLHGSDDFNLKLSVKRAESVKNYLIKKGISPDRLTTKGKGKSEPVIKRVGEGFDAQNRRTEFNLKFNSKDNSSQEALGEKNTKRK